MDDPNFSGVQIATHEVTHDMIANGEIDPETVREWEEKLKKYGAIPKGENPVRDVAVPRKTAPNKYVSQFARTMMESKVVPDIWQGEFEQLILDGKMSHERISNDTLIEKDRGAELALTWYA